MIELHPTLKKDSFWVRELDFSELLLMNNALYPWLILVPKKSNVTELVELTLEEQILLLQEINLISRLMQKIFTPDKLNIASLGNLVPQLHIHIIARYKNDRNFPKVVWADNERKDYEEEAKNQIIKLLNNTLDQLLSV